VKDILSELETRTAVQDFTHEEGFVPEINDSNGKQFIIDKFPREFKKNYLQSFDIRFVVILLFSFVVHIIAIVFLESEFPATIDSKAIIKIQQQYVDLLIDNKLLMPSSETFITDKQKVEPLDYETITGLTKWVDGISDNVLDMIKDMPAFSPEIPAAKDAVTQETRIPTKEELMGARESAAKARVTSRSELEREVSSIGLLGLIGSRSSTVDHEYIDDLLEYADLNEDHLGRVLSKLNSIQVPHHNTAGYILSYKQNADIGGGELKGGRHYATDDVRQVIRDMEPIAEAKTTQVKRTTTYEEIVPSNSLDKLRTHNLAGKKRDPKDVVRAVQSHKRALQDCYKQELKVNPAVHGKIVVRFTVDPHGNVVEASIVTSSLDSPDMESCIINRIKNWRNFGQCDPSIGNVTYKQVFNFGESG